MSMIKSGFTPKGSELPDICIVVAYFADKTYQVYSRDGNAWNPVRRIDEAKWQKCQVPKDASDKIVAACGAKEVEFFELTPEARQRKGNGFEA